MAAIFYKPIIERINNHGCTSIEVTWLIDIFISGIKKLSRTAELEAYWDSLADFYEAHERNIDGFSLKIERKKIVSKEQWLGTFEKQDKRLELIATFEKIDY